MCTFYFLDIPASLLGEEGEDPEFSLKSWFAMLFSAGMGIGLVFWTTAEPISHAFTKTPIHKAEHNLLLMMPCNLRSSIGDSCMGRLWNRRISFCLF